MGRLEVVCGPMFCGKTSELIRRVKRVVLSSQRVQVFKPWIDDRFGRDAIVSHGSSDLEKITGVKPIPIKDGEEPVLFVGTKVVAFDEVQFFEPTWFVKCVESILNYNIRIICAGLDMDSFGKPFGVMPILLSMADEVLKLKAVCQVCKEDASRTFRLTTKSQDKVLIGGSESYEPRCFKCWKEGKYSVAKTKLTERT